MTDPAALRKIIKTELPSVTSQLNSYLRGNNVSEIEDILQRTGRGGKLPHWYDLLVSGQSMPNLDGKTIGSVIEMTLLAVLEKHTLAGLDIPPMVINPAKGVDFPYLDLGVKSPSENYCTSEPFFSAYERVIGNISDAVVLLTDYQTAKSNPPPIRIQVIGSVYLHGSEIADSGLCMIAAKHREMLLIRNEAMCKKFVQFLCHINQQDWRAKNLLKLLNHLNETDEKINKLVNRIATDFEKKSVRDTAQGKVPISTEELKKILVIKQSNMKTEAIINACSDWVVDYHKDFARLPNDNEWQRFIRSPLDGKIGMSFALQWRYNFGNTFAQWRTDRVSI